MDFHVQRGEPIRAELWNALVDALGLANQIFPGKGIRRFVVGGRTILSAPEPSGAGPSKTPYILGSTRHGSDPAGPGGTTGPWGGLIDAPDPDLSKPRTDTWHRERRPRMPDEKNTDSVVLDLSRTHVAADSASGSQTRRRFTRTALFDGRNTLVSISAETLEEEDSSSGGSGGGGIL